MDKARQKILDKLGNGEKLTVNDVVLWKLTKNKPSLLKRATGTIKEIQPLITTFRGLFL